jgi:hypothetical protein
LCQAVCAEFLRQIEEFSLEGLELEYIIEVTIVPSSLSQDFPLHLQHSLQLLLDALQAITVVLILSCDLQVIFLHGPCHHLVVLVIGIHHDD